MFSSTGKLRSGSRKLPKILTAATLETNPIKHSLCTNQFNLFQKKFGQLASRKDLQELKPCLMEIDIAEEIAMMKSNSSLEISVPVLGVTDLLQSFKYSKSSQQFATVLALNGFGALEFPCAEFILVTDIVGNEYEVVVDREGNIELPKEGTGLFSVISAITFIFSAQQIKGQGLEDLTAEGIKENKLTILPPVESTEDFSMSICVTHLNDRYHRIVDSIRTVEVKTAEISLEAANSQVDVRYSDKNSDVLHIDMALMHSVPFMAHKPFSASISLETKNNVEYGFVNPEQISMCVDSNRWLQHPLCSNVYTKHFGLSNRALMYVIRDVYSQFDFMRELLNQDNLLLSHQYGYNDFLLREEAIENLYDMIVHDLVTHKISVEFLLERVPKERLMELDLSHIPFTFHDSIVIGQLQAELSDGNFRHFEQLFLSESAKLGGNVGVTDYFNVYAIGLSGTLPNAKMQVSPPCHFKYPSDANLQHMLDLENLHDFTLNETRSFSLDEEEQMLNRKTTNSRLRARMIFSNDKSSSIVTTTLIQAEPQTEVNIDPKHIHRF